MESVKSYGELLSENTELRLQLEEAHDAINAIRGGKIDALIIQGNQGNEIYTLKSADHTYRVFIEKMSEGAVTLNPDGTILYSNSRFAAMVDYPLEKVIGKLFSDFIPEYLADKYDHVLEAGWTQDVKTEIDLKVAGGKLLPCLISCNQIELDKRLALSLILTDLTSQKESERELLIKNQQLAKAELDTRTMNDRLEELVEERTRDLYLSREQFKFLANQIPVIVWSADPSGEVNYFNSRWYDYTGLTLEQSKEQGWESILHPDDVLMARNAWNHSVKTGQPYEIEYRFRRTSDGQYRWHLGYGLPFKDDKGQIIAWFGTGTDIEEQKRQIEKRDEFIGIASHELKTPLTTVKAYLEIIGNYKKEAVPQAIHQYVSKAQGAMRKLQNLVNDLLDVSKINSGQLLYDMAEFNLSELVNSCIENFQHLYPERKLVCRCEDNLMIYGNIGRIEQVIMNLISNAVKYSPANTNIEISAINDHSRAIVSVIDFGIGLSDEQEKKIFERFYRVEDQKFRTSGLGMGLYISSEIVKFHQGKLNVSSQFGKGSTFSIELPLLSK